MSFDPIPRPLHQREEHQQENRYPATFAQNLKESYQNKQEEDTVEKKERVTGKMSLLRSFTRLVTWTFVGVDVDQEVLQISPGFTSFVRSSESGLRALYLQNINGELQPVGRSYAGRDWETSAGVFASEVDFTCYPGVCSTTLPPIGPGESYQLLPFEFEGISTTDEIARFLEQATFGGTLADIDAMMKQGGNNGDTLDMFATWMQDQIDPTITTPTLHRAYFRERLNSRFEVPFHMGVVTHPCQTGTHFRLYAFSLKDFGMDAELETVGNKRIVKVDGKFRTVVSSVKIRGIELPDGSFRVCRRTGPPFTSENGGSSVALQFNGVGCVGAVFDGVFGNPPIKLDNSIGEGPTYFLDLDGMSDEVQAALTPDNSQYYAGLTPEVQEVMLTRDIFDEVAECSQLGLTGYPDDKEPLFIRFNGAIWIHDPRFVVEENSVEKPIADGGGSLVDETEGRVLCSAAPRTFVNEEGCVISDEESVCGVAELRDVRIRLDFSTLKIIYDATGGHNNTGTRYVYAVDNLEINSNNPSACEPLTTSRWVQGRCDGSGPTVSQTTLDALAAHLSNSEDTNGFMRDIFMPETGLVCDSADQNKRGFEVIDNDGTCWKHVHPLYLQVFDMTYWTHRDTHPGNMVSDREPIKELAWRDSFRLVYPRQSHGMEPWEESYRHFGNIGRLGDLVDIKTFPDTLLTEEFAEAFNALDVVRGTSAVVCGTPGEVSNDLSLGGDTFRGAFDVNSRVRRTTVSGDLADQRKQVWATISLQSKDQLRQRVAWALSQILVVSPSFDDTEPSLAFYDIFVRHAFGNYRDILMEVSYSPVMAEMLTYLDSKSTAYIWESNMELEFPDENMAREIMQLFSTGLYELQPNGNPIIENGERVRVYLNDDIEEYARMWTGFRRRELRGNVEYLVSNRIDPMLIEPLWRDQFPKMGLKGEYIGDRYPLCRDLPERSFLARGAKYRRIGATGRPELQSEPSSWTNGDNPERFRITQNSQLYEAFCDQANDGSGCRFPMNIVLDADLACAGDECDVDVVRTVEVEVGVFYEYVRQPCVEQAFFSNAMQIVGSSHDSSFLCADPLTTTASAACCTDNTAETPYGNTGPLVHEAFSNEVYWGERVKFITAASRCPTICSLPDLSSFCEDGRCANEPNAPSRFWTDASCKILAKIDPSDGTVALVHQPDGIPMNKVAKQFQDDTKTFFRVHWKQENSNFPTVSDVLTEIQQSNSCWSSVDGAYFCPVQVEEKTVFSESPVSADEALEQLWIGAIPPAVPQMLQMPRNSLNVYNHGNKDPNGVFSDSIFHVVDEFGRHHYLKNQESVVRIDGTSLSFRNPPHFIGVSDRELRDIQYETSAAVDQYFYHSSTAPFLAIRLAQRFGNSNPSPRYIGVIAEAFRKGIYTTAGTSFGKGIYGDLEATIAAVLLDTEARSPILDSDFGHGSLREPLLKLIGTMRALEFSPNEKNPLVSFESALEIEIGQQAHELPSVFSFFLPEFLLAGSRASHGGLVSPEAMALTTPKMIATMNGLFSLLRFGLDDCFNGFGFAEGSSCDTENNSGNLYYSPSPQLDAKGVVDQMATLLTAGRLSVTNREIAQHVYEQMNNKQDALVLLQQLITSSSEFHSTGGAQQTGVNRLPAPTPAPSSQPYKAIVVVQLAGGADSWNMLVPHKCDGTNSNGKNIREQYIEERGGLAFIESERTRKIVIDIQKQRLEQPCQEFVVHDELQIVHELYEDDDLAFFANMGVLNNPSGKIDYNEQTITTLFAHNAMQLESQRLDPYDTLPNTGMLGRALEILESNGFRSNGLSIDDFFVAVQGKPGKSPDTVVVSREGTKSFNPAAGDPGSVWDISNEIDRINRESEDWSNVNAEIWSDKFLKALEETESLKDALDSAQLKTPLKGTGQWDQSLGMVSRLIQSHTDRGVDRDVIHVSLGGWDHHSGMKEGLRSQFRDLNRVLAHFVGEMKALGFWDDVVLAVTSDFGRTLTPNSGAGSDHAWGGHYFMMGGEVSGGQIHGQYPFDITAKGPLNIGRGRGRMIPNLSWESMWNGVLQWFGVPIDDDSLDRTMPNRKGSGAVLFDAGDLFDTVGNGDDPFWNL